MFGTYEFDRKAKIFGIIVPVTLTISLMLVFIGVSLPFWIHTGNKNYGIFQVCNGVQSCLPAITEINNTSSDISTLNGPTIWKLFTGLGVGGATLFLISEICLLAYNCTAILHHGKVAIGIAVCICIFTGASAVITLTVLMVTQGVSTVTGTSTTDVVQFVGWSFYTTCCGSVLGITSGILFVLHLYFAVYF